MPWLRRAEIPPSEPALSLHLLRLCLRQVRHWLLPFELNLRTHCIVDGCVRVSVSDEVNLGTSFPTLT
jgi:hypothetical protein